MSKGFNGLKDILDMKGGFDNFYDIELLGQKTKGDIAAKTSQENGWGIGIRSQKLLRQPEISLQAINDKQDIL